jgi:murein L,D-transpeptidase YcbB/YkuD
VIDGYGHSNLLRDEGHFVLKRSTIAATLGLFLIGWAAPALTAPRDLLTGLADKQAINWRGKVVDINLIGSYYADAANPAIWTSAKGLNTRGRELLASIEGMVDDGLNPADYRTLAFADAATMKAEADIAGLELALSNAFVRMARDLHSGRTSPSVTEPDIVIARKPMAAEKWLESAAKSGAEAVFAGLRPNHPQYFQLRQMLAGYRNLAARGGWPLIDSGSTLKPGMVDPRVRQMRASLKARGYSGIDNADPNAFDPGLTEVVKHFQKRHGLDADAFAGPATIAALNTTADQRVEQIIVNMERWRWLPADLGKRHVFVNQAGFEMFFVDGGKVIDNRRVIVGKPFHKSPMFSDMISYVDFNPTWTVTPDIAKSEFLPKLQKDPGYLERNEYKLYAGWGAGAPELDPYSVDWNGLTRLPYKIVQQPGGKNALGDVKFMFPNKFNVYLHDTPSRQLFAKTGRAFTHGCIRVHEPLEFATKLLGLDQGLTRERIDRIVAGHQSQTVVLKRKVPIHLAYFTVWIDDNGIPNFYDDLYDRDRMVSQLLFRPV